MGFKPLFRSKISKLTFLPHAVCFRRMQIKRLRNNHFKKLIGEEICVSKSGGGTSKVLTKRS